MVVVVVVMGIKVVGGLPRVVEWEGAAGGFAGGGGAVVVVVVGAVVVVVLPCRGKELKGGWRAADVVVGCCCWGCAC